MATVSHTQTFLAKGAVLATWAELANGDDGTDFANVLLSRKTVQVVGTFGEGGTVVLQGSNDGTNYVTLTDADGGDISFDAAGMVDIRENPRFVRPDVTAGDGTTELTVLLVAKGDYL